MFDEARNLRRPNHWPASAARLVLGFSGYARSRVATQKFGARRQKTHNGGSGQVGKGVAQ